MKKNLLKVLFISQEITPYVPETEVSSLCRSLPEVVQMRGLEMRAFMPRFGCINERRNQLHEVIRLSGMNLIIDDTDHTLIIKVASIQTARMQVYFIDNEDYFHRRSMTADENGEEYDDNDERTIFFVRGVMETVKKLRWTPDIIHCHGWMTALAPLYVKRAFNDDPFFRSAKVVYSVYNDMFKKPFRALFADRLKLNGISDKDIQSISKGEINFNTLTKFAIDFSDAVIQGSEEIPSDITKYIKKKGITFLPYQEPERAPYVYCDLYKSLLN